VLSIQNRRRLFHDERIDPIVLACSHSIHALCCGSFAADVFLKLRPLLCSFLFVGFASGVITNAHILERADQGATHATLRYLKPARREPESYS